MNEESKIAIVSHGAVVEFNPNNTEHEEALNKANAEYISSKVEFQRKLRLFEDLLSKRSQSHFGVPWDMDKEIDNFTKVTGIELSPLIIIEAGSYFPEGKLADYLKEILSGKSRSATGLKVGGCIKCWDGKEIPILAMYTHLPRLFVDAHTFISKTRNDFSGAPEAGLAIELPNEKEATFCSDLQLLVDSLETLRSKNVISGHGYTDVKKELLRAFNNKNGTRIDITAFTKLIKKEVTPSELFVHIAEKKEVSSETYRLIELHLKGMRHDHISVKPVTWEDIGGVIKVFKDMYFIEFYYKDLNRFFSGAITAEELLLLYVKLPEKKITTRAQYDQALNILIVLLDLFTPNAMTREDVERAKVLHIQFNIRFDIDMSEEDFLAIIYRHGTPRCFLKKHATTEAAKGE